MFNLFKKKEYLGILSYKNIKNVTSNKTIFHDEFSKIHEILKKFHSGEIVMINFQTTDSGAINISFDENKNYVLIYSPQDFPNTSSIYYELQEESLSSELIKKIFNYFFLNKEIDKSLNWISRDIDIEYL